MTKTPDMAAIYPAAATRIGLVVDGASDRFAQQIAAEYIRLTGDQDGTSPAWPLFQHEAYTRLQSRITGALEQIGPVTICGVQEHQANCRHLVTGVIHARGRTYPAG